MACARFSSPRDAVRCREQPVDFLCQARELHRASTSRKELEYLSRLPRWETCSGGMQALRFYYTCYIFALPKLQIPRSSSGSLERHPLHAGAQCSRQCELGDRNGRTKDSLSFARVGSSQHGRHVAGSAGKLEKQHPAKSYITAQVWSRQTPLDGRPRRSSARGYAPRMARGQVGEKCRSSCS